MGRHRQAISVGAGMHRDGGPGYLRSVYRCSLALLSNRIMLFRIDQRLSIQHHLLKQMHEPYLTGSPELAYRHYHDIKAKRTMVQEAV
jgi:hypothetical protein